MLLFQKARKENKLSILQQLFDHLKQKEHRMNLFNVAYIIVNRIQPKSSNNQRDRENVRNRDESRNNF